MEQRFKFAAFLLLLPLVTAKRGFLLTSSQAFFSENTETVHVTLFDVSDTGTFQVILTRKDGMESETVAQVAQIVDAPSPPSGQLFKIELSIPKLPSNTQVTMKVDGKLGNYTFEKQRGLTIYTRSDATTFIQTDKPIYKPSQLVKIRILPVDSYLRPIGHQAKADIWIENPSGIRLVQWLQETFEVGMKQYEMELSEKPDLGQWTIYVNVTTNKSSNDYQVKTEHFRVEEYVLPKFEVIVKPPPFAFITDNNVTWNICGRYTYGKMVKGNLTLEATFEAIGYWDRDDYPPIRHKQRIEGCANYTMYLNDLRWRRSPLRFSHVKLFARIKEDGTEVEQNATGKTSMTTKPFEISFTYPDFNNRYFKPEIPFFGQLTVKKPDNTPKPDEKVHICYDDDASGFSYRTCKTFTSDEKGVIRFTVPPRNGNIFGLNIFADPVNFSTKYDGYYAIYKPRDTMYLSSWYSKAKRYIKILPVTETVECGSSQTFTVYLNGQDGEIFNIFSQVMSRDGIVSEKNIEYVYSEIKGTLPTDETYINQTEAEIELGIVSITVETTYEMAPKGYLLVYYTTQDGEIIADSVDFDISKCLKHKVGMEFLSKQELPGAKVGLKVTANPKSLCGIGAVDKSVYVLSSSNALTADKVFDALSKYGSKRFKYSYYLNNCVPRESPDYPTFIRRRFPRPFRESSSNADALTAFQDGNFLVLTDLTLVTKPCRAIYYHSMAYDRMDFVETTALIPQFSGGSAFQTETIRDGDTTVDAAPPGFGGSKPIVEVRDYFPETFLFEIEPTDDNGEFITKRDLPHTVTEWVGSAVCLHKEDGVGVSPTANVLAFQPFFVSATLPYSVIRGEILPLTITVFNYLKACLPITLKLDESTDFTLENGILEHTFCVCGGDSVSQKYLIKPIILGQLNFTSRAFTNPSSNVCGSNIVGNVTARDAATNSLLVEAEGFKRQESFSNFFCPSNTDGTFKATYVLVTPDNYVPDSGRAEFLVTGDLMGPALRNIDNLVQMPTGCGEQNMLNFVPDIFILDYLTNTGKLGADTEKKLLEYLKTGYQRELTYRHTDGSYSAFGNRDPTGSIWLSAFVVKAFQGASKYIFVDKSDISRTVQWILANQDNQGCFPGIGEVHHTAMQGGSGSSLGSKATLTSYILISLLEAELANNNTAVEKALSCLGQESTPTTYTLALMTYAACLAKAPGAEDQLEALMNLSQIEGSMQYWEDDNTRSSAIQIEIASYAILSLLSCDVEDAQEKALPIVRWISQRRNANGGFISTQDTVMALQALAVYSTNVDRNPININITMEAQGVENQTYHVDESNKLLVQVTKLPELPTPVVVEATGSGCALVQANLFYNIATPPGFRALRYNMSTLRGVGGNCKKAEIRACMRHRHEGRFSNMAVLEVRLPSGYEVDQDSLDLLKRNQRLFLKRADVDGSKLALYFSKISRKKLCYSFMLDQAFEVQNLQPSTAKLFDYYQPENQISRSFALDKQCP